MEKRIKSIGSYQKSGKLFLNEFSRIQKKDSFEKNEYYLDFFSNGNKVLNTTWYKNENIFSNIFNEYTSLVFDKIKLNQISQGVSFPEGSIINHTLKAPESFKNRFILGNNLNQKINTSDIATPSSFPNDYYIDKAFKLSYNASYAKNISINELNKYNQINLDTNIKKAFLNKWKENNIDDAFNDSDQNYLNINVNTFFTSGGEFGLLKDPIINQLSYKNFENIKNKLINNELDKINAKNKYSNLDSSQKKEKVIEIDLNIPNDLILQYMAKTTVDDIIRNPSANRVNIDTESTMYFSKINTTNSNQPNYLNQIRFQNNIEDRKINRFNTPFAIYNFSYKNWENRGLFFPLLHIKQSYLTLPERYRTINWNNNTLSGIALPKINYSNNNITSFLEYFKKYFISHDTLTMTSTLNAKKEGKSNDTNNKYQQGTFKDYSHTIISLPTEQFGFPNHYKFHCFSDNLLNLSNFIEKPFVLSRTNFKANVEVIGEFVNEDSQYYEEPFNLCLNYFLIKQTELDKNTNINTKIKPFANKTNIANYNFNYTDDDNNNVQEFKLNNLTFDFDDINSDNLYDEEYIIRKLSDDTDHYSSTYTNPLFYFSGPNSSLLSNTRIPDKLNKKYVREIINYGNILFLTPSVSNFSRIIKNDGVYKLLENNNFDSFKIIEYPDHLNLLTTNNLTGLIDFSGEININSICKIPSQINIKHQINAHLLNLNFDLPSNNNFEKFSGTRTLDEIISPKQFQTKKFLEINFKDTFDYTTQNLPFVISDNDQNASQKVEIPSGIMSDYYLSQYQNISSDTQSEYVLYPNDKIAICVSISPSIHPLKAKQLIKIKKGKCKISLFGYHKNDSRKIYDENRLLKNYKSNNFPSVIIGDILNTNEYSDLKQLNYLNYLDRQFDKTLDIYNDRELSTNPSILKQGKTFIPYLRIGNDYNLNTKEKFIYDDAFLQYTTENETTGLNKKYFVNNIFDSILMYKKYKYSIPVTSIITQSGTEYIENIDDYSQNINNLNLKQFNMYFSSKRYGHFRDILEQRKDTTMYNMSGLKKESVVSKQYIDSSDGSLITDLSLLYGTNKSLTYELVDSKGVPVSAEDNITFNGVENLPYPFYDNIVRWNNNWTWSYDDILNLKHVAFMENVTQ